MTTHGLFDLKRTFMGPTTQQYHELLDINMHVGFYTLREAARHMVARATAGNPGGSIIVCGSLSL